MRSVTLGAWPDLPTVYAVRDVAKKKMKAITTRTGDRYLAKLFDLPNDELTLPDLERPLAPDHRDHVLNGRRWSGASRTWPKCSRR